MKNRRDVKPGTNQPGKIGVAQSPAKISLQQLSKQQQSNSSHQKPDWARSVELNTQNVPQSSNMPQSKSVVNPNYDHMRASRPEQRSSAMTYKSIDVSNLSNSSQNKNYGLASRFKNLSIGDVQLPCVGFDEIEESFKKHGKFIGRGSYGQVHEGLYQDKPAVAKFSGYDSIDEQRYLLNEIICLDLFDHANAGLHTFLKNTIYNGKPQKFVAKICNLQLFYLNYGKKCPEIFFSLRSASILT